MSTPPRLGAEQLEFFSDVAQAAFANPFSPERESLNRKITGIRRQVSEERLLTLLREALEQRLGELRRCGPLDIRGFNATERSVIETAVLFQIYYDYRGQFDRFIIEQSSHGEPILLPFAAELLDKLEGVGIERSASLRYLALFYQLRRASYFIEREITGHCPAIIGVRMHLWNAIFTFRPEWYLRYLCGKMEDFSTLLLGETGTGKTAAARAIGLAGFIPFEQKNWRFKESFACSLIAINLAEYPAGLIESQLFGHKRGAFTGAIDHHRGVLACCSEHGSVFIDEIGDVDLPTQLKLLTVLQERTFTPVGGHEKLRFQGRVIAATNKNLDALRTAGQFRDDFYYRLCSDIIVLPPLRQRLAENPEELRLILETLIRRAIGEPAEPLAERIAQRIRELLPNDYPWPGNVRELEQCVRRICLTGKYSGDKKLRQPHSDFVKRVEAGNLTAMELLAGYCRELYKRYPTYEEVARVTGLDRRTVRKYIVVNERQARAEGLPRASDNE